MVLIILLMGFSLIIRGTSGTYLNYFLDVNTFNDISMRYVLL